jgi:hypothetical protein
MKTEDLLSGSSPKLEKGSIFNTRKFDLLELRYVVTNVVPPTRGNAGVLAWTIALKDSSQSDFKTYHG